MDATVVLTQAYKPLIGGVLFAGAITAIIATTAAGLSDFALIGPPPFNYPWRLVEPTSMSQLSAWLGYAGHNLAVWGLIAYAQRQKPRFNEKFRWFNWAMIGVNVAFAALHIVQTQLWFDGLAQDVPEITALGSVALMLMVILILEAPRRGLFWGKGTALPKRLLAVTKAYHGYLFSWALIYTFWYHPAVATTGHLWGFFISCLLWQSVLIFNRAHMNRWWTLFLEILDIPASCGLRSGEGHVGDVWLWLWRVYLDPNGWVGQVDFAKASPSFWRQ